MESFRDVYNRSIRLTRERQKHFETAHPEMAGSSLRISETLAKPDRIVRSVTDGAVELFYRHYATTPVTTKFLCVVVKVEANDYFVITAYYTDTIKRGENLWQKTEP